MISSSLTPAITHALSSAMDFGSIFNGSTQGFDFTRTNASSPTTGTTSLAFSRGTNATQSRKGDGWLVYGPNNMVWPSSDLTSARWTFNNATIIQTAEAGLPDGVDQVFRMTDNTTSGNHNFTSANYPIVIGSAYATSVYAKAGTRNKIRIQLGPATVYNGTNPGITVNLIDGSVVSSSNNLGAYVEALQNGWYRIGVSQFTTSGTNTSINILMVNDTNSTNYVGDGSFLYVGGVQLEIGPYIQPYNYTSTAAYFGPRFESNPITLENRGLLVEEQRSNIITYSSDFNNAIWGKTDATITSNNTIAPTGIQEADLVTVGSANTEVVQQTSSSFTAGSVITQSVYLKRGNHDWIRFSMVDGTTSTDGANAYFNIADGSLGSVTALGAGSGFTSVVRTLPNGWYRVSLTGVVNATDTTAKIQIRSATANNNPTRITGGQRYQYGAQVETGTYLSSYIPTYSANATRALDVATVPYSPTNLATFYLEVEALSLTAGIDQRFFTLTDGTANNRIMVQRDTSNNIQVISTSGGVNNATRTVTGPFTTGIIKIAFSYNNTNGNFSLSVNGSAISTTSGFSLAAGMNVIYLSPFTAITGRWWTRKLSIYPTYRTDLQNLTS